MQSKTTADQTDLPLRLRALMALSMALVLAVVVLYGRTAQHGFLALDDRAYVVENSHVTAGVTWYGVKWAFGQSHASNYHPITWLSHMLDCQWYGLEPAGHHMTNVLLHATNSVLLLICLYGMTNAWGSSVVVAALFAFHPLRVESVAWIAERKDVLSGLFWMLTMIGYSWYVRCPNAPRYLLVILLFVLGLLAKQMLVTLPVVLLLLDVWPLGRYPEISMRRLMLEKIPLLGLSLLFSAIIILSQKGSAISGLEGLPLTARMANAAVSCVAYLWKTVWPQQLAIFYPHPALVSPHELGGLWKGAALSVLFLLVITLAVVMLARRRPYLAVGWAWYLVTLLPVIGLVQVGLQAMADRYSYLPTIGITIMIAWGVAELFSRIPRGRRFGAALSTAVIAIFAVCSWSHLGRWQSTESLYLHALETTTNNYVVHDLLGVEFGQQERFDLAEKHLHEALRIQPDYPYAHTNLGMVLAQQGHLEEAEAHWLEALRVEPDFFDAHKNLGVLYDRGNQPQRALDHFRPALEQHPDDQTLYRSLALQHEKLGQRKQAVEVMQTGLSFDSGNVESLSFLAALHLQHGRPAEAKALFQQVLEIDPQHLPAREGLVRINTLQTESTE